MRKNRYQILARMPAGRRIAPSKHLPIPRRMIITYTLILPPCALISPYLQDSLQDMRLLIFLLLLFIVPSSLSAKELPIADGEKLFFIEYHDPGWMMLEDKKGRKHEAWFHYDYIKRDDIKTWENGEIVTIQFENNFPNKIIRDKTNKAYRIEYKHNPPANRLLDKCTLKNKEFCGDGWKGNPKNNPAALTILGSIMQWDANYHAKCTILFEGKRGNDIYSVLECLFIHHDPYTLTCEKFYEDDEDYIFLSQHKCLELPDKQGIHYFKDPEFWMISGVRHFQDKIGRNIENIGIDMNKNLPCLFSEWEGTGLFEMKKYNQFYKDFECKKSHGLGYSRVVPLD